jgi:hypothetical protein
MNMLGAPKYTVNRKTSKNENMEVPRRRGRWDQGSILTLELLRRTPDGTLFFDDLEDSGVRSCLTTASFTTNRTRITRAPATMADELGPDKERAESQTRRG